MSWKTWTVVGLILIVVFAIYIFAAPETQQQAVVDPLTNRALPGHSGQPGQIRAVIRTPGVDPVHNEWLESPAGSFSTRRNVFAFPVPPPPKPPPPPPAPPDKDKDGIPDFRDNCVNVANPLQEDIDRDGIGTACETEKEIAPLPPPPPEPQPPAFSYRYIGTFGNPRKPIATFTRDGQIVNARVGDIIEGKFILRGIGIESVEIGFIGFPPNKSQRIPLGQ